MIAKGGALKYCLVLIRALIAVQMTQWNSATISKDRLKIDTTRRFVSFDFVYAIISCHIKNVSFYLCSLICLIAKSELVPDIPFNQLHLALPYLDAYEVFCLMDDLWKFLKDSQVTFDTKESEIASVQFPPLKPYFERLRIIASEKFPGDLYVQFFHPIQSG